MGDGSRVVHGAPLRQRLIDCMSVEHHAVVESSGDVVLLKRKDQSGARAEGPTPSSLSAQGRGWRDDSKQHRNESLHTTVAWKAGPWFKNPWHGAGDVEDPNGLSPRE